MGVSCWVVWGFLLGYLGFPVGLSGVSLTSNVVNITQSYKNVYCFEKFHKINGSSFLCIHVSGRGIGFTGGKGCAPGVV